MDKNNFNPLEIDFIEYLAERHGTFDEAQKLYKQARIRFARFRGKSYQQTAAGINEIYRLFHHPQKEEHILDAYKALAGLHLLRYLSYSFPKAFHQRLNNARELLRKKQYKDFFQFGRRYLKKTVTQKNTVDLLLENGSQPFVIVDYGCGTAPISSKIAQKFPSTKVYLLDVDTLVLEFTVFRFTKYKYNFEVIKVTKNNLYPSLPEHNMCLANEVMEHVFEPLLVYDNIYKSMELGGCYSEILLIIHGICCMSLLTFQRFVKKSIKAMKLSTQKRRKTTIFFP